jgi:hypothetical protein
MKAIVTTTIKKPSEALKQLSMMRDWRLYVVGDQKTPHDAYQKIDCVYIHPDEQKNIAPEVSEILGWGCIQRRNIGFIKAYRDGAEIFATIDDDNIPLPNWGTLVGEKISCSVFEHEILFDPFTQTSLRELWHRGFPCSEREERFRTTSSEEKIEIKVQAGFWHGKPDADALSRMLFGNQQRAVSGNFPFASRKTIFSSQNAFLHREIMPHYSVLPFVGRMDDIWGCIVMQKRTGSPVVFTEPSTLHDRNEHDIISDLNEEWPWHEKTLNLLEKGESALPEKTKKFIELYYEAMRC